jgi:hypothetical protein
MNDFRRRQPAPPATTTGNRVLVVELSAGTFQYSGVTPETWRRFAGASSPWSFFRDNIEEDYPAKRIR